MIRALLTSLVAGYVVISGAVALPLGVKPSITLTADQAFDAKHIVGKVIEVKRVSCVYLGFDAAKEVVCEGKGSGGRSTIFMASTSLWDTDTETEASRHLEKNCAGTANLGSRRCFFTLIAEVRSFGSVQFLEVSAGATVAAREIYTGPARLRRSR
jgi:hypothetical protein